MNLSAHGTRGDDSMSLEKLVSAIDKIASNLGIPGIGSMSEFGFGGEWYGYSVRIAKTWPKMVLASDVTVSPEFRAEINQWMLSFFGEDCLVKQGEVIVMETLQIVYVHPLDYQDMKRKSEEARTVNMGSLFNGLW